MSLLCSALYAKCPDYLSGRETGLPQQSACVRHIELAPGQRAERHRAGGRQSGQRRREQALSTAAAARAAPPAAKPTHDPQDGGTVGEAPQRDAPGWVNTPCNSRLHAIILVENTFLLVVQNGMRSLGYPLIYPACTKSTQQRSRCLGGGGPHPAWRPARLGW